MKIQELNDQFRSTLTGGQILFTPTVDNLPGDEHEALWNAIQSFDNFTTENDPHGEHDFGAVEIQGEKYFWKIDYYDNQLMYHSPDPTNPDLTKRVLTVMHASEY